MKSSEILSAHGLRRSKKLHCTKLVISKRCTRRVKHVHPGRCVLRNLKTVLCVVILQHKKTTKTGAAINSETLHLFPLSEEPGKHRNLEQPSRDVWSVIMNEEKVRPYLLPSRLVVVFLLTHLVSRTHTPCQSQLLALRGGSGRHKRPHRIALINSGPLNCRRR